MKEKQLAITLGLSRDFLKEIRSSYEEGKHWLRLESKKPKHLWEIQWTDEGVQTLAKNLEIPTEQKIEPPAEVQGTVCGKYKNLRLLKVLVDGKENNVICRDSTKFGIGMNVFIKWDGIRWCVVRHPRFKGKY
jgi:hypothetical protein